MKRALSLIICSIYLINLNPFIYAAGTGEQGGWNKGAYAKAAEEQSESVLITALEGGFVELGGARIDIPSGALAKDTQISIKRLLRTEETGDGLYNVTSGGGAYRFEPAGLQFLKEVQISIAYTSILEGKDASLEDTYTYFYDVKQEKWVALRRLGIEKEKRIIHSATTHFTDMINATLTLPENPSSLDFNLNSIKGLEAARADAQVAQIDGLQADSFGDASFQLKFETVGGIAGMVPQVSVRYSSGSGNGIMGKGFDVQYGSSIAIDTRWGLPTYADTDTYVKDGVLLETTDRQRYYSLKDSEYSLIERKEEDGVFYWQVTEKDGRKKLYGKSGNSWAGKSKREKNIWYIEKEEDIYGNSIDYVYEKDAACVYIKEIRYTNRKGKEGNYRVVFEYEDREDIRVDARGKYVSECKRRLQSIGNYYEDGSIHGSTLIRSWQFDYTSGLSGTSLLESVKVYGLGGIGPQYEYAFEYEKVEEGRYFAEAKKWEENAKPLSVSSGVSGGGSMSISAGVGVGIGPADARITGGGQGSFSEGESYSDFTLVDINGDGRADSVRKKGNKLLVSFNNAENGFSQAIEIDVAGMHDMDLERNQSFSGGANIYGGGGFASVLSAGASYAKVWQNSYSDVKQVFTDVDGDGLTDILESGKSGYLKNQGCDASGNFRGFDRAPLLSEVSVSNAVESLSEEEKKNYEDSYYIQTPFRSFKFPYSGTVQIGQRVSYVDASTGSADGIEAVSYDTEGDEIGRIRLVQGEGGLKERTDSIADVKSGEYVYFISDSGIDTRGDDIRWNIRVRYTRYKPFYQRYEGLSFYPQPIIGMEAGEVKEIFHESEMDNERHIWERFVDKAEYEFDERLKPLYEIEREIIYKKSTENGETIYKDTGSRKVWLKLKSQWLSGGVEKEDLIRACETLIAQGRVVSGGYSQEELEKIKRYMEKRYSGEEKAEAYRILAHSLRYDGASGIYRVKQGEQGHLYEILGKEGCKAGLNVYESAGIVPQWQGSVPVYRSERHRVTYETRQTEGGGSIYGAERRLYLGEYEGKRLYVKKTGGVYGIYSKDRKGEWREEGAYHVSVTKVDVGRERIEVGIGKTTAVWDLDGYTASWTNRISTDEYAAIQKDRRFYIRDMNIDEAGSIWRREKLYEEDFDDFFREKIDRGVLTQKDESDFIRIGFEQKREKAVHGNEVVWYRLKKAISEQEIKEANDILGKWKEYYFSEVQFPYYERENEEYYRIKEEWKGKQSFRYTESDLESLSNEQKADLWIEGRLAKVFETVEAQVLSLYVTQVFEENARRKKKNQAELTETEKEQLKSKIEKKQYENKTKEITGTAMTAFSVEQMKEKMSEWLRVYYERRKREGLLNHVCSENKAGYYKSVETYVEYGLEEVCAVTEEGVYILPDFEGDRLTQREGMLKNYDSARVWQAAGGEKRQPENHSGGQVLYTEKRYTQVSETNLESREYEYRIEIGNEDVLYGGEDNWYYGIWTGRQDEQPFRVEDIADAANKRQGMNADEATQYRQQVEGTRAELSSEQELSGQKAQRDVFYAAKPDYYTCDATGKIVKTVIQDGQRPENDLSYALLGHVTVQVEKEAFYDAEGNRDYRNKAMYYTPFIAADEIHTNRAGGVIYYKIPGLYGDTAVLSGSSDFIVPDIRKTASKGTDTSKGANVGFQIPYIEKDHIENLTKTVSTGSDIGGTKSTNKSTTRQIQSIQDINADGIPDILVWENGRITVTAGRRGEKGIVYDRQYDLYAHALSVNESTVRVNGASFSPSGSIKIERGPKGSVKATSFNGSSSKSGSSSTGTNMQTAGLLDINGDGIADYIRDGSAYLGTGEHFSSSYIDGTGNISGSVTQSVGISASLGAGGSSNVAGNTATFSLSVGAGLSYSASAVKSTEQFIDINADGLPDKVYKGTDSFFVAYNLGNRFASPVAFNIPAWDITLLQKAAYTIKSDGNILVSAVKDIPVVGGIADTAIARSENGLTCNAYGPVLDKMVNELDFSSTVTVGINGSLNVGANIPIPIPLTPLNVNVTVGEGGGANSSVSLTGATVKMLDIDGDGLADHVLRIPGSNGGLWVKRNLCGKADLLKTIKLPQGGSYALSYELQKGTVLNPHSKYVLSQVDKTDGMENTVEGGTHRYTERYSYAGGYYDRNVRDFYGFARVTVYTGERGAIGSVNTAYTEKITTYYNDAYYRKGMVQSVVEKSTDPYSAKEVAYRKIEMEVTQAPYAQVKSRVEKTWEANGALTKREVIYEYDNYRNVNKITEIINDDGNTKLEAVINYAGFNASLYLHSHPSLIEVYDNKGRLLRKREGSYNTVGSLIGLSQYWTKNDKLENALSYTERGELKSITDSKGITLAYEYSANGFMSSIRHKGRSGGVYESSIDWNEVKGVKTAETDINGNVMYYEYDDFSRLTAVYSPYDNRAGLPSVRYSYYTPKQESALGLRRWYTITENKVLFDSNDTTAIKTINEIDGLGRTVRTGKTGIVYKDGRKEKGWNVSGSIEYDAKARAIKTYMTYFVQGESVQEFLQASLYHTDTPYTISSYDGLDRTVEQILPDGARQANEYYIENMLQVTKSTDPLQNVSIQYSDVRGNIVAIERKDEHGKVLTKARYEYDVLGQLLTAYPADEKYPVSVTYDLLGRKTSLASSDSGKKEYTYNNDGELAWETDSVLKAKGQRISYEYDEFSRIKKIDYPYSEDTVYEYGANGAPYNRAGKIVRIQDETGTIEYKYGKLGETTEEKRTIKHVNAFVHKESTTAVMSYVSDYLGRMQKIVYPDTEVIRYGYDAGGQVTSITGTYAGLVTEYVRDIGYDEYGQRVFIEYGNGVKTEYTYDKARRWLDTIRTQKDMETYQNIEYSFDKVGNVLGYKNDTTYYSTEQNYSYDGLYQLTEAQGTSINKPYGYVDYTSNYKQTFGFDSLGMGNMTAKISSVYTNPSRTIGEDLNYSLEYEYDENYAHRVKRIGNRYYSYDENGNVVLEQDEPITTQDEQRYEIQELGENLYGVEYGWALENEEEQNKVGSSGVYKRRYRWNERNLMQESSDNTQSVHYRYGQDGQRALKSSNQSETLYFNAMWSWLHNSSAYNTDRESKHIYLGTERLVTRMNGAGTQGNAYTAQVNTYYYHSDHLGSAQLITDNEGKEYERIEYTPYGEYWIEKRAPENKTLPFKFTGKERDEETGLYYYGTRYLDPRTSRWLSADPALGEYMAGSNAGAGGIYNQVNFNLYHYAGNNPIKYTDPNGKSAVSYSLRKIFDFITSPAVSMVSSSTPLGKAGCTNQSLYNQQFHTMADQRNGMRSFLGGVSIAPGVIGVAASIAVVITPAKEQDGIVDFNTRRGFIAGAQEEVNRIETVLNGLSDSERNEINSRGETYGNFLESQKVKLNSEIESNKEYDKGQIKGINHDLMKAGLGSYKENRQTKPESYVQPIDYQKAFRERRPDE